MPEKSRGSEKGDVHMLRHGGKDEVGSNQSAPAVWWRKRDGEVIVSRTSMCYGLTNWRTLQWSLHVISFTPVNNPKAAHFTNMKTKMWRS